MTEIFSWPRTKSYLLELYKEVDDDKVFDGAAALAFYLFLALFPLTILLLSILPYLPLDNMDRFILDYMHKALPGDAAHLYEEYIKGFLTEKKGGILSFGILGTLWAASSGFYALIQQLNVTYDVEEKRSFIKLRLIALELLLMFILFIVTSFLMIVAGDAVIEWAQGVFGFESFFKYFMLTVRWVIVVILLLTAFACTYYVGPNVQQSFRYITPGSCVGVALFLLSCVGFKIYVENFGDYSKTYGSLGAVIVFMLWLYVLGFVFLLGSEINAISEFRSRKGGKNRGDRKLPGRGEK